MAGRNTNSAADAYFAKRAGITLKEYQGRTKPLTVRAVVKKIDTLVSTGKANPDDARIGTSFAYRLRTNLIASIRRKTEKRSGLALRSNVKPQYVNGFLNSLTIAVPYYIFPILNNGFEGSKKKGVSARVKEKDFLNDALENGKFVKDLADEVGGIRAAMIVSRINYTLGSSTNDKGFING